jgi:nicotinamidase-related amidase
MPEVAARPYPYTFDPRHTALLVIDMQRDFIEPGGFGEALGNDVSRLGAIVPHRRRAAPVVPGGRRPRDPHARRPPPGSLGLSAGEAPARRSEHADRRGGPDGPHPRGR